MKIKFKDNSWGFSFMTRLDDVSRIDEVLRNTPAFDKAGLVVMDKEGIRG